MTRYGEPAPSIELIFKTTQGPKKGVKDWYYHFKGHMGEDLIIHEHSQSGDVVGTKTDQTIVTVQAFMMMGKYPHAAKEKLQKIMLSSWPADAS